jgi:hypothetical protein
MKAGILAIKRLFSRQYAHWLKYVQIRLLAKDGLHAETP